MLISYEQKFLLKDFRLGHALSIEIIMKSILFILYWKALT